MLPGLPVRAPRRSLLLLPLLCLASCGPGQPSTPPVKQPPLVTLTVPEPNVAGFSLRLQLSVTGCDSVSKLEVYDGTELLKAVSYTGDPTPVVLGRSELRYARGIPARPSLIAKATCADGREGTSQSQPAVFFPVAFVQDPPNANSQVVTDFFVADGRGDAVAFIGCGVDGTGRSWLYRVNSRGEVLKNKAMPFPCTPWTQITERHPVTGKRWVWTPNQGAAAFDEQLEISGRTTTDNNGVDLLAVGPDGDAVMWDERRDATPSSMRRLGHATAFEEKWKMESTSVNAANRMYGIVVAEPRIRNNAQMVVPMWGLVSGEPKARVLVGELDYARGVWSNIYQIEERPAPNNYLPMPGPAVAFDPTGNLLFVARQVGSVYYVAACAATSSDYNGRCENINNVRNQRWITVDLPDPIVLLLPYAGGSRLAAIGPRRTWFINALDGQIISKSNQPLATSGTLVTAQVYAGKGSDFYMLNAPPATGTNRPYSVEILATDAAEQGELFRYEAGGGGSLSAAMDDDGRLWMRVGRKLVRPLPLSDYRAARGATP
jgi:hypothetical protein